MKKTILITGANSGIGFETARELLKRNYLVILACRSMEKAEEAQRKLIQSTKINEDKIGLLEIDLASFESIRKAVESIPADTWGLICNAAVSYAGPTRYTQNGIEETFGVNHLGHFLLVNLLLKKRISLKRITVVSSAGHDPKAGTPFPTPDLSDLNQIAFPKDPGKYEDGNLRYANSKLCNIMFTYELAKKLTRQGGAELIINAFNPGMVPGTGLARNGPGYVRLLWNYILPIFNRFIPKIRHIRPVGRELSDVATTMNVHGKYIDKKVVNTSSQASYDEVKARELWAFSEKLTELYLK